MQSYHDRDPTFDFSINEEEIEVKITSYPIFFNFNQRRDVVEIIYLPIDVELIDELIQDLRRYGVLDIEDLNGNSVIINGDMVMFGENFISANPSNRYGNRFLQLLYRIRNATESAHIMHVGRVARSA
jgi:hypothetical protein